MTQLRMRPRIRTIKPEFFSSEKVAALSFPARILYEGLWCFGDDHGRGLSNVKLLKAYIFPLDDEVSVEDVTLWYKEIESQGMIHTYIAGGEGYYHVVDWAGNQAASHRRSKPMYPAPTCMQVAADGSKSHLLACEGVLEKGEGNREGGEGMPDSDPEI